MNSLGLIVRCWQPSEQAVKRAALASVMTAVLIVVTGGAVRLTESGLGCETWPKCTDDSLTPTADMGIHGVIEFGNRMMIGLMGVVAGLVILTARSRTPVRRDLGRLGWAQFWIIMGNGVVGGITVMTGLNPYIVSSHFLLAMALLTVAVVTWQRAREGDAPARYLVTRPLRQLTGLLVASAAALIVIGTVVTGAGPHAGDARKVHRIPLDWQEITQVHVDFVYIVVGLTVALWFALRAVSAPAVVRRRVLELLAVLAGQSVIGYVQYFTHLPELVIGAHMFGSCLVWIAVLRIFSAQSQRSELPARPMQDG
ncbi:COX15/CtaA family protein [Streptomyces sp. G7(2002)]|uniref:COX15/CtaA family protein n=1 Tax=Streptomyces sp. G7(2002) TaxID=2971798 RepID=UPI00237E6161|nr:COX15/CtaA family protein [Streptomyces sp. G7(2002)]WDT58443.1 COX15/CtaA family protein [Streptomyces sp. G7(2002)]